MNFKIDSHILVMIYKYRKLSKNDNTQNLLRNGELFFPSPKKLNDPFDSLISINVDELSNMEIDFYLKKIQNYLIVKGENPGLINSILSSYKNNKQKLQGLIDDNNDDVVNQKIGVFSSSTNWDNLLMWSHYGDNHAGVVVSINEKMILKNHPYLIAGLVNYPEDNKPPILLPSMKDEQAMYNRFFYKAKDWKYENEFRFINDLQPPEFSRKIYCKDSIEEVTVGFNCPLIEFTKVMEYCKSNSIRFFQTKKVPHTFLIDRVEI